MRIIGKYKYNFGMKKFSLLFVCLLLASNLLAQKNPAALKNLVKAGGKVTAVDVAKVEATALERTVKKALEPVITTSYGTMSVTAYFHRMGNMEFWTPPISIPSPDIKPFKPAYGSQKRTREWLIDQLTPNGFKPQILETMSYEELDELLTTYAVFSNATVCKQDNIEDSWTRDDKEMLPIFMAPNKWNANKLTQWALKQPDFYLRNYLPLDYNVPFHPDVKSLRILLISDDSAIKARIITALHSYNNIDVDMNAAIGLATKRLENTETKYDIIVTDVVVPGGKRDRGAYDVGMYVWNKKLDIPVVALSRQPLNSDKLILSNIVGQALYLQSIEDTHRFFNYLSNIVATGKAYPNDLPALLYYKQKLKELDLAIEQSPDDQFLYEQRSNVRRILGDKKGARSDAKKAEELFYSTHSVPPKD